MTYDTKGKELAQRQDDGKVVKLWWFNFDGADEITITVRDLHSNENFTIHPTPDKAMDAFNHPYAYKQEEAVV